MNNWFMIICNLWIHFIRTIEIISVELLIDFSIKGVSTGFSKFVFYKKVSKRSWNWDWNLTIKLF